MSDTVMVALITFLAGLSGSIVGAIATYKSASLTAKSEQSRMIYNEKKIAYAEYLSAHFDMAEHLADVEVGIADIPSQETVEAMHQLIVAHSKARLFAPPHIQEAMKATGDTISTALRDKRLPTNSKDFDTLADAMQKDLYSFNAGEGKKPRFRKKK